MNTVPSKRRRLWRMRLAAVSFPFVLVLALEAALRVAGLYADSTETAQRQIMELPPGTSFFPEWDQTITLPKPANTRRLFVLGGSSAMGLGVERPFSRLLQDSLAEKWPDQNWEVINGGVSAYGSQRTLAILKRACKFQPDLILVYLGHNEFLEDVFYDPKGLVGRLQQGNRLARRIRVVNLVRSWLPGDPPKPAPKLQRHFLGNSNFPLIHSESEKQDRIAFLKSNLREMAATCRQHGVRLVLVPAVTNLLAPPGDPAHTWEVADEVWTTDLDECQNALKQRDFSKAARLAQELLDIDSGHAMAHYFAGLSALGLDHQEQGEQSLVESTRLDWRGDRAFGEIQNAILAVAIEENVAYADVRPQFNSHLLTDFQQMVGGRPLEMFLDHCHPTQAGHKLIAESCMSVLVDQLSERNGVPK